MYFLIMMFAIIVAAGIRARNVLRECEKEEAKTPDDSSIS
jgi:hypothetical protein